MKIINKNTLFVENKQHNHPPKSPSTIKNINHNSIIPYFKTFFNSQLFVIQYFTHFNQKF
jgi:hypothetical protein